MDMYRPMNSSSVQDAYVHQYKSARVFLEKCSLLQYLPIFITEGFDSIEAINEITEEDLSEMGIKRGHRRVMQRAIATEKGIPTYQPLTYLVANPTSSINSNFGWETSANENASSGSSSGGNYSTSGYGSMSSSQPSSTTPLRYSHSKPEDSMIDMSDSVHNGEAMIKGIANSSYSSNEELEEVEMLDEQDEEDEDEDDDCTIQRKYRRHPKRDKNTPIKPPSAYIMFSNDARTQLKDQNMTFVEIAKYVGDLWKNLDSSRKREYERTAMREKDHYVDRLNRYRKTPEYKKYQVYLKDFKSKQDAMNRKIARFRKLAKLESANSANSGSNTNGNSTSNKNTNNNFPSNSGDSFNDPEMDEISLTTGEGGSSTSSGSSDIYKVHREKLKNKEFEEVENNGSSPQPMNADPKPNYIPFINDNRMIEDNITLKSPSSSSRRNLRSKRLQ